MRMKMRVQGTLIEMMGEFSEAGEPVPLRRRTLYPAELWVHSSDISLYKKRMKKSIQKETGGSEVYMKNSA